MQDQPFDTTSDKSIQQVTIGFRAYGFMIDNLSNQWYYEPSARRWVPPYTLGISGAMLGTDIGNLLLQLPPPLVNNTRPLAPIPGETARIVYFDQFVPAGPGVAMNVQGTGPYFDRVLAFETGQLGPVVLSANCNVTAGGANQSSPLLTAVSLGQRTPGARAFVETIEIWGNVTLVGTAPVTVFAILQYDTQLGVDPGPGQPIVSLPIWTGAANPPVHSEMSPGFFLFAGDTLNLFLGAPAANGGNVHATCNVKIVEIP